MQEQNSTSYFKDKVVIITGGAGGLATALTKQLISSGAKIAALDLNVDSIEANDNVLPITADITDTDALTKAVSIVMDKFCRIDILFNNAGITHMSRFKDVSPELFSTIMAVNFTGAVNITRLCLPHLINSRGQIVAISSVAGFAPLYGRSAYSASKHAMEGFFRSLAPEVAEDGVAVTVVCPSFVRSRPELKAKVNSGISSPGALKKSTGGEQISPERAAKLILIATEKRKPTLYLGRIANIARWLFALMPQIYIKIMSKGARKEFE